MEISSVLLTQHLNGDKFTWISAKNRLYFRAIILFELIQSRVKIKEIKEYNSRFRSHDFYQMRRHMTNYRYYTPPRS